MLVAVTRAISPTLADCELTHLAREPIDVAHAVAEHGRYEDALRSCGARVVRAAPEPDLPDAVFVEDAAVAFDEVAVIARPGAPTRRGETESLAALLSAYRPIARIRAPGTLDGGDVLRVGRRIYVGQSSRTNREGGSQLATLLAPWDYEVIPVATQGCLHLKSAVTQVGEQLLLINPRWIRPACLPPMEVVEVAPGEPHGANALWIEKAVIYPTHYPETAERLDRAGVRVVPVPCSELAKAEGGVTCCSVLFESETAVV